MKKVYLAALLSLSLMTANAQEPNIPMFGVQQNYNVKFDEYKNPRHARVIAKIIT